MLSAAFVLVFAAAAPPKPMTIPPGVAAMVNGSPITDATLDASLSAARMNPMIFGQPLPAAPDELRRTVLDQLISAELLGQEAKAKGITVPDAMVDASVKDMRSHFGTEQDWQDALKDHGLTEKDMRDDARRQIAIKKLLETVLLPKVPMPDEKEVKAYYDANPALFTEPEELQIAHILVIVDPDFSEARRKKARAKIEKISAQARKGKDFAALAKAESEDEGSKDKGGDVGFVRPGEWPDEFLAAASVLKKKGELSGIVETRFGYHVLKLLDRLPPHLLPFDDKVKADITTYLDHRRQADAALDYTASLRMKAKIEIAPALGGDKPLR